MRIIRLLEIRNAGLRYQKCGAHIDFPHQVEALGGRFQTRGHADCAGIIHQHIDAAKLCHSLSYRGLDRLRVAHIQLDRQRLSARLHYLIGHGEYRAG